jgi:hypothetical protein
MMKVFLFVLCLLAYFPGELLAQSTSEKSSMKVMLMSDLNESYGSTHYGSYVDSAMAYVAKWQPDLVLFAGDMIAGQSLELSDSDILAMWTGFDETIGRPMRGMNIPFAFTLGNHDGSKSGNFDHERALAKGYWSTLQPDLSYVNKEHFPFYYSFQFNDIFVISWDASGYRISEEEVTWIEEQLSQDLAKNASIRIVLGHLPLFGVAKGRNRIGEVLNEADKLFEMMISHNVNYYFSGHHHAWYPAEKDGLRMIHSGAQGSGPRPLIGSDLPPRRTLTLLERETGSSGFNITTFDLQNSMNVISPNELPPFIEGINGRVARYDYSH